MTRSVLEAAGKILQTPRFRQMRAASGPLLLTVHVGSTMGFSAVLLPQLRSEADGAALLNDSPHLHSFIASSAALPMALGAALGGALVERLGGRTAHVIACVPAAAAWLSIALCAGAGTLLAGRLLAGLAAGVLCAATGVYVGETAADPALRGVLLGATSVAVSVGVLASHVGVASVGWRAAALALAALPPAGWGLMRGTPESPRHLARREGRRRDAEDAFCWLRGGRTAEAVADFEQLRRRAEAPAEPPRRAAALGPTALVCALAALSQWTGHNAVVFHSVAVMRSTLGPSAPGHAAFDEYTATYAADAARLLASAVGCLLLRAASRRRFGVAANAGAAACLLALAAHALSAGGDARFALAALLAFVALAGGGVAPLPWALAGELLGGAGAGAAACASFLAAFAVVHAAPAMFEWGAAGAYSAFAAAALAGAACVAFLLPETGGRSLETIRDELEKPS